MHRHRRRPLSWGLCSIFITVAIIVTVTVTVRYTASGDNDDLEYGPTDTRIISVSNALCEKVYFTARDSDSDVEVHLYALSSRPLLTGRESFSLLNEQPHFTYDQEFQFYYYYMPKGSMFSVYACLLDQSRPRITFYLIQGHKNFGDWKDDYSHSKDHFRINTLCQLGNSSKSYTVNSDDFYYLVFEADSPPLTNALNVSMYFERTRYEVDNSSVIDSCSSEINLVTFATCSLGLPLSGSTSLLTIKPVDSTDIDWKAGVTVDIGCNARIWMYFIISLSVLIGVVGILVTFFVLVYCCVRHKKKASTATTTAATTTATTSPANLDADRSLDNAPLLHEVPPSANPNFPPGPSSSTYGSDYPPPPPYKE